MRVLEVMRALIKFRENKIKSSKFEARSSKMRSCESYLLLIELIRPLIILAISNAFSSSCSNNSMEIQFLL